MRVSYVDGVSTMVWDMLLAYSSCSTMAGCFTQGNLKVYVLVGCMLTTRSVFKKCCRLAIIINVVCILFEEILSCQT